MQEQERTLKIVRAKRWEAFKEQQQKQREEHEHMVRRQYLKRYWITYLKNLSMIKKLKANFLDHRSLVHKV